MTGGARFHAQAWVVGLAAPIRAQVITEAAACVKHNVGYWGRFESPVQHAIPQCRHVVDTVPDIFPVSTQSSIHPSSSLSFRFKSIDRSLSSILRRISAYSCCVAGSSAFHLFDRSCSATVVCSRSCLSVGGVDLSGSEGATTSTGDSNGTDANEYAVGSTPERSQGEDGLSTESI